MFIINNKLNILNSNFGMLTKMMRFIIYLEIQCIPHLEPFKICNKCHKFKNEIFFKKAKMKKVFTIDHVINHILLANHNKIQIIVYIFIFLMYIYRFSFRNL